MSYIDESKPAPAAAPQVVYRNRTSPVIVVLLTLLVVCVAALTVVIALPYLGVQLKLPGGPQATRTKEQILAEIDPAALVLPSGRQLSLVEFGQRVFEISRINFDASSPVHSLVYITVPGTPPQQGAYHIGDSFDRGRIAIRDILQQSVILACDGQQMEFKVYGALGEAVSSQPQTGINFMPPKNMGSGGVIPDAVPGSTGRIKAPLNPRIEEVDLPVSAPEPETDKPKSLEEFPDQRPVAVPRAEYKPFVDNMKKAFEESVLLMPAIDPDNRTAYGLECKNLRPESLLYRWGLRTGDVLIQINETEIRKHKDFEDALHDNNFRNGMQIHVMRDDLLVSFLITPSDAG
ncbi:MAG: hypothetical protein IT462_10290 [Planctomycetes bacterium]|nr:hypothetical protein [Planctomycetota bacterium]